MSTATGTYVPYKVKDITPMLRIGAAKKLSWQKPKCRASWLSVKSTANLNL